MIDNLQAIYDVALAVDWVVAAFAFGFGVWIGDSGTRRAKMIGGVLALAVLFYYAVST